MIDEAPFDEAEATALAAPLAAQISAPIARFLDARAVEDITRQIELIGKIRRAVVAATTPSQWQDFDGNPYLEADGAYTIGSLVGLSFAEPVYEWRDLGDGARQVKCRQRVQLRDRAIDEHGDCDSFDPFLRARRRELEKNGATPSQIETICASDMEKKARANAVSRAVSAFCGLRGLSWDDLAELGLARRAGGVKFRKGSSGGAAKMTPLAELAKLAEGSEVSVHGSIVALGDERRTQKGGAYFDVRLRDESGEESLTVWTGRGAWQLGDHVHAERVRVKSWNGRRQNNAEALDPYGMGGEEGSGNGN